MSTSGFNYEEGLRASEVRKEGHSGTSAEDLPQDLPHSDFVLKSVAKIVALGISTLHVVESLYFPLHIPQGMA